MNLKIATKILNKYVKCPMCGHDKLGNGHGALIIEDEVLESTEKIRYDLIRDYHLSFWSMESMFELISSLESTNKLSDDSNISKFIDEQYEIKIELEKLFFDFPGALSLLKNHYSTLDKYR